jgi:hypothetical protein
VTWQHPYTRSIRPAGVLTCGTEGFTFAYVARADEVDEVDEVDGFQPFMGFADLHRRYTSPQLFPLFAQRVMRASRPDYPAYLRALALADDATAWAILARSQGERENDGIRVFAEPEVDTAGRSSVTFFVSGLRHRLANDPAVEAALGSLVPFATLQLRDEPDNAVNPRAVLVVEQTGTALAWVPDVLLDHTHTLDHRTVAAVNGSDVPAGFRLLVTLRGQVPMGYVAFDGPGWALAG